MDYNYTLSSVFLFITLCMPIGCKSHEVIPSSEMKAIDTFVETQEEIIKKTSLLTSFFDLPLYTALVVMPEKAFEGLWGVLAPLISLSKCEPAYHQCHFLTQSYSRALMRVKVVHEYFLQDIWRKYKKLHELETHYPELSLLRTVSTPSPTHFASHQSVRQLSMILGLRTPSYTLASPLLQKAIRAYASTYDNTGNKKMATKAFNKELHKLSHSFLKIPLKHPIDETVFLLDKEVKLEQCIKYVRETMYPYEKKCFILSNEIHKALITAAQTHDDEVFKQTLLKDKTQPFSLAHLINMHNLLILEYLEHVYITLLHYQKGGTDSSLQLKEYPSALLTFAGVEERTSIQESLSQDKKLKRRRR